MWNMKVSNLSPDPVLEILRSVPRLCPALSHCILQGVVRWGLQRVSTVKQPLHMHIWEATLTALVVWIREHKYAVKQNIDIDDYQL